MKDFYVCVIQDVFKLHQPAIVLISVQELLQSSSDETDVRVLIKPTRRDLNFPYIVLNRVCSARQK